jgi:tagatose 6-phosphate kinase
MKSLLTSSPGPAPLNERRNFGEAGWQAPAGEGELIYCINLNATEDLLYECDRIDWNGVSRAREVRPYPGGKGSNVARALALMGAKPILAGFRPRQSRLWNGGFFEKRGIRTHLMPVPGSARPCLILRDHGRRQETVLNSPSQMQAGQGHLRRFEAWLKKSLKSGDLACLSGSLPQGLGEDAFSVLIKAIQSTGARALFDSSGRPFALGLKAAPFLAKPNQAELEEFHGGSIHRQSDLKAALKKMAASGVRVAMASLGEDGCLALSQGRFFRAKALKPKPGFLSPVGCGDSFLAGMAWSFERGLALEKALKWATAAAWANLNHAGSVFMDRGEIEGAARRVSVVLD